MIKRIKNRALIVGLLTVLCLSGCSSEKQEESETDVREENIAEDSSEDTLEESLSMDSQLPYLLEDGKLEVRAVFQYSGINVDCGEEEGTDIGAIELTNCSEEYLQELDLKLILSDGSDLQFYITDIPAGKTVWAFDTQNLTYSVTEYIVDAQTEAVFSEGTDLMQQGMDVSVNGMEVEITNKTDTDVEGLAVICHTQLDGKYFGGISYTYPLDSLEAGADALITAQDCLIGDAEVVRITYE